MLKLLIEKFPVENCMLASVISEDISLVKTLKKLTRFEKLGPSTNIPLKNLYRTPKTLGSDRLANAIAGSFLFPRKNVLIIDMGTCIKYDFVNEKKQYLGGSISPGINMRFKAMHNFTGKLPLVGYKNNVSIVGKSTAEAMQSGVVNGIAEESKGMISRYKKQFKVLRTILTGGDSRRFAGDLNLSIFAASDLVNIGLNEIIRYNSKE